LKITVIEQAGFCFGVKRAIQMAFAAAEEQAGQRGGGQVFSLGSLIHNPQVVEKLAEAGVGVVERLEQVKAEKGVLLVRSHGLHPSVLQQARQMGLRIIDATCPFVKKVQEDVVSLKRDGYQVVIIGDKDHPEIQAIKGDESQDILVAGRKDEVASLPLKKKIGVVAQTTQSFSNFQSIISELLGRVTEIKIFKTICEATTRRQRATLDLAGRVDLMIIVGGRNSANTNRLLEICQSVNTPSRLIEVAGEIQPEWLAGKEEVGVSAGASTPEWIIAPVVERLKNLSALRQ